MEHGAREHPTTPRQSTYLYVFLLLALFTAMEIGITFLDDLPDGIKYGALIILAASKVGLVVLYFMHLRFDHRLFALPIALGVVIAVPLILILSLSPPESGDVPASVSDTNGQNGGEAGGAQDLLIGERVFLEKCVQCHALERVTNVRHDREEWTAIVDRMIGYGCPINDQERTDVIDYLAMNLSSEGANGDPAAPEGAAETPAAEGTADASDGSTAGPDATTAATEAAE